MAVETEKIGEKAAKLLVGFLGSWWAVFFHAFWFIAWIILQLNLNHLVLLVCLEVIFIGIFLLMASNKAEEERELKEKQEQAREMEQLKGNLEETQIQTQILAELRRSSTEIAAELGEIKNMIRKTQSALNSSAKEK